MGWIGKYFDRATQDCTMGWIGKYFDRQWRNLTRRWLMMAESDSSSSSSSLQGWCEKWR
jgi:hypothetical protein